MTTAAQFEPIACESRHPLVIKAAAEFPQKLHAVHGDRIVIRETAVYFGNGNSPGSKGKGIDVSCSVCGYEWSTAAVNLLKGHGCPECNRLKDVASTGTIRRPRATPEEKQRAAELRELGWTCNQIANELGRSVSTILNWLEPAQREKTRLRSAQRYEEKRDHLLEVKRSYRQTPHGKAGHRNNNHVRRVLQTNAPEVVFLDGEWLEVDREESYRIWSPFLVPHSDRREMDELAMECMYITEKTGIEHHVDHIWPLSKGGEHLPYNLQILPSQENLSKNDKFRFEDQIELARRLFG